MTDETISCDDLNEAIEHYTRDLGFRLDMITPADAPREAIVSARDRSIKLVRNSKFHVPSSKLRISSDLESGTLNLEFGSEWTVGRAGMMYRDLIPDRLGGKLIASHIRIVDGGEVADSVHYHKVAFQAIYCLKGAIRVVYEDQGEPLWLRPGDCVLQPRGIRHRVLEAETGSEVIEVTSPAEQETWFDHEMTLPIENVNKNRLFGHQRFVRHLEADSRWKTTDRKGVLASVTEISGVRTLRTISSRRNTADIANVSSAKVQILIGDRGIEFNLDALRGAP